MVGFFIGALGVQLAVSAIVLLLIGTRRFMKQRYVAKMRYFLWLALALRVLLPFSFSMNSAVQPVVNLGVTDTVVVQDIPLPMIFEGAQNTPSGEGIPPSTEPSLGELNDGEGQPVEAQTGLTLSLTLPQVIAFIWLFGAVISFLVSIFGYIKSRQRLLKNATYATDLEQELKLIKKSLGINRHVSIMYTKRTVSPLLIGFFRPIILLNCGFDDAMACEMVLRHELLHLKRGDIAYLFILNLASNIYWFNPLIRYMETLAREDIELSCDEQVIEGKDGEFKLSYAETLLSVINHNRGGIPLSTSFSHNKKVRKERFNAILRDVRRRSGRLLGGVLLVIIVSSGALIGCTVTESEVVEQAVDSAVEQLTTPPLVTSEPQQEQPQETPPEIIELNSGIAYDNVIYFHDIVGDTFISKSVNEQGEINVFCQKEDCTHDNADCDAAVPKEYASARVFEYDSTIYSLVFEDGVTTRLYRIDENGYRDKEPVAETDYFPSRAPDYLYDGKIYFIYGGIESRLDLMSLDLASYETETVVQGITTNMLAHAGSKLYYFELISREDEVRRYAVHSVDLATGETKTEYETDIDMMSGLWINDGYMMSVSDYHHLTVMDYATGEQLVITENLGGFVNWEGGYFTYAANTVQNMEATTGSSVILTYVDIPKSFESGEVVFYEQTYIIGKTYPEFSHVEAEFENSFLIGNQSGSPDEGYYTSYYLIDKTTFWNGTGEKRLIGRSVVDGGWMF